MTAPPVPTATNPETARQSRTAIIDDIAYHAYDTIDPAQLNALFASEYAPGHDTLNPRFLDWLYRDNPAAQGGLILARDAAGELRGSIGVVPFRLAWGERELTAYVALHVLVHPQARGMKLFDRMIEALKTHLAERETFLFGHPESECHAGMDALRHALS